MSLHTYVLTDVLTHAGKPSDRPKLDLANLDRAHHGTTVPPLECRPVQLGNTIPVHGTAVSLHDPGETSGLYRTQSLQNAVSEGMTAWDSGWVRARVER